MKSKLTNKKICYLEELSIEEKNRCNEICNLSFPKKTIIDYMVSSEKQNIIISLLYVEDLIVGLCFAKIKRKNVIKPLSNTFLQLNTICIDPKYRGKGLCFDLVQNLLKAKLNIEGKMYNLGRSFNMYLYVGTAAENPNIAAIKCYQKNGFSFVDMLYESRGDGELNIAMVRKKGNKSKSKKSKNKKSKKKKSKK